MDAEVVGPNTTIIGFDSAWTDKPGAPGAVCAIRQSAAGLTFEPPVLATFKQALEVVREAKRHADRVLVALDQPTIVNNTLGSRPVDKVAGSLVSWVGGGVQPANRSKVGMFDDNAPIWRFKSDLAAIEEPEAARAAAVGTYLIEVFPALALPSLVPAHCGRLLGAKYNPERRNTFRMEHWQSVSDGVAAFGLAHEVIGLLGWAQSHRAIGVPRKSDQDLLDAVLCAVVGYMWLFADRSQLLVIGDLRSGYMVTPAIGQARSRLLAAAHLRGTYAE